MTIAPDLAFSSLADIDWDSTTSILADCTPAYDAIVGAADVLNALLTNLPCDATLAAMCERYDFMDKLVLHDAPSRFRIRLHLYRAGYFDRPHPHRWDFFAGIYQGSYRHRIFGTDEQFNENTDPRALRPLIERIECPGSTYALHHRTVHSVQAEAGTISLVIRGPATSDRFLVLDAEAGRSFWVYGRASETPEQRAAKQMSAAQLAATIDRVRQLTGLDSGPATTGKRAAR